MSELLIRAAMNDHLVVGDLLAPRPGPRVTKRRQAIGQLVADAHVAAARPVLAEVAREAGVPYLIDPDTVLLQSEVTPDDKWAALPFGRAEARKPQEIDRYELVESVVEFQLDHGATVVVPPYFYASSPDDEWFALSLDLIEETATYLRNNHVQLPVLPVLAAQLQGFAPVERWPFGIDRFTNVATVLDIGTVALCLSPSGAGSDGYGKITRLFNLALRAKERGPRILAWRQGIYGPALVAAGLDGYECGIGTGEQTNLARRQASRKPHGAEHHGPSGGGPGVFIEPLGRSVPRGVGQMLLGNASMRPKVMCDDEGCCPSVAATLDHPRHHAVRTRARLLRQLDEQPHRPWRLNHVARNTEAAVTLARQANRILEAEGDSPVRINAHNLESLAAVLAHLADDYSGSRSA